MKSKRFNPTIKRAIILSMLLLLWPLLTLLYIITNEISFTTLTYNHAKENLNQVTYDKILKGDKVTGSFEAQEPNLGIVSVRFAFAQRVAYRDEDLIAFRLKETGAKEWYYENNYRAGLMYTEQFFPFGFPIISDSKNKTYVFEIESLKGNQQNAVQVSPREPVLASKYQASRAELLADKSQLLIFTFKKFVLAFSSVDVWFIALVNLVPLLLYIVHLTGKSQPIEKKLARVLKLKKSNIENFLKLPPYIVLGVLLINLFFLQLTHNLVYLSIFVLWLVALKLCKLDSKYSYGIGFVFILIAAMIYYGKFIFIAEYVASWAFIFFVAGIVQSGYTLRQSLKKQK